MTFEEFQKKKKEGGLINRNTQSQSSSNTKMSFDEFKAKKEAGTLITRNQPEIKNETPEVLPTAKPNINAEVKPLDIRQFALDIQSPKKPVTLAEAPSTYKNIFQNSGLAPSTRQKPLNLNVDVKPVDIREIAESAIPQQQLMQALAQAREETRKEQERWDNLSLGGKIADPFKTAGQNISFGSLVEQENLAWSEYRKKQDAKSKAKAESATRAREEYQLNNDRVGKGNAVTKDFAQYLPQLGGQLKAGLSGAALGALTTGSVAAGTTAAIGQLGPQVALPEELVTVPAAFLTGAGWGGKGGYVTGTAKYGYETMSGAAYKNLLDMGVPNDIALEISGDEALVNSLIEGGGSIVDLITLGFGKIAGKGLKTAGKEVAKNSLKNAAKAYGVNLVSEPLEEMAQEKVSIESEKRAAKKAGIERNASEREDAQRIAEAGKGGFNIALVGGAGNVGGNIIANQVRNNTHLGTMALPSMDEGLQQQLKDIDQSIKPQQPVLAEKPVTKQQKKQTINKMEVKDSDIKESREENAWNSIPDAAKTTFENDSGYIEIMERPDGKNSIFATYVKPESRNQGIGTMLLQKAIDKYGQDNLIGQFSSAQSVKNAYKLGFRAEGNLSLEETLAKQKEQSSVYMEYDKNLKPIDKRNDSNYNVSMRGEQNEFRRIQEEARAELNKSVEQRNSTENNEGLRERLSTNFRRELDSRGYHTGSANELVLKSNKGTEFKMHQKVDGNTFHDIFEIARAYTKNGELVDLHTVETTEDGIGYAETENYLSEDGMSGFAITPSGDLISVFNADSSKRGFLDAISSEVKKNAKTLDCFASENQNLMEMYEKKFGFKTASIMDYNMEYDHDDIAKNHNMPKVAFMVNTSEDVETKYFNGEQYSEAESYRNSFAKKKQKTENVSKFASAAAPAPYMDLNKQISTNKDSNVEKTSLSNIEKSINDIVPVKLGKFRQKAYGIYKNKGEIIRIKQKNDIPVALHELTHHLDKKYNLSLKGNFKKELLPLAVADEKASMDTKIKEGVAEFGRYYFMKPEYAQQIAPKYYAAFEKAISEDSNMKQRVENLRTMMSNYLNQSPLNRTLSHIDFGDQEADFWTASKEKGAEFLKSFRKNFVDDLDPLKKIVNEITNGETLQTEKDPYSLFRLSRGVTGKTRVALEYGVTDDNGKKIGKSMQEIIEPVSKNIDGFVAYLSALRAKDLEEREVETGFNKKDVESILETYSDNETFKQAADDLYKFQQQMLEKTLVKSGFITKESAEKYAEANPHYVPFYRVMDENFKKSKDSLSKAPKKIKGSTRDIINPLESIVKNVYSYTLLAERNDDYRALFNLENQYDGTGKWFDKVPADMVGVTVSATEVQDLLDKINDTKGAEGDTDYNELFTTVFRPANSQKGNIITAMKNGKPVHYEIMDKELYDILMPPNIGNKENALLKLLRGGATTLRTGATHNLEFVLRNPFRDTLDAATYSKNGFVPFADTIRGVFEIVGRSDLYYKWLESGGSGSSYTNAQRKTLRNTLENIVPTENTKPLENVKNVALHPLRTFLDYVGELSNIMEEGTRVGEFKRAYEKTGSAKTAALDSRNVTLDFSKAGTQGRELNRYIAFLNARIQGIDKMYESFKTRPKETTMKALFYLTIPSMILAGLQDDDELEKVPDWERDAFWVINVNGTFVKIPKPQGLGPLFATVPERIVRFLKTEDPAAFDGLMSTLISSYSAIDGASSIIPTGALPLLENTVNYSFFKKTPIVSRALENRSPKNQYDENTSTIAKTIGGAINVSPKKIDNLISGYGGGLGKDVANIIGIPIDIFNSITGKEEKQKEYQTFNTMLRKIPLIKGFVAGDYNNKELDKFYEEKAKANQDYQDVKFEYADIKTLPMAKQKRLDTYKEINRIYNSSYTNIGKKQDEMDKVRLSKSSSKLKEQQLEKLTKEIKVIATEAEKEAEKVRKQLPKGK